MIKGRKKHHTHPHLTTNIYIRNELGFFGFFFFSHKFVFSIFKSISDYQQHWDN